MMQKTLLSTAVAAMLSLLAPAALAQDTGALRSAVERALAGNPEVAARKHAFLAAGEGVLVAKGARGPRVDLSADAGMEQSNFTSGGRERISRAGFGLTVSQVLFDGMGTRHENERVAHERMSRWFELVEATEATALEAVRAHYDVQRFRRLVALAQDNLAQHKQSAEKISSRVKAGVGRGVDSEQANARVALAESNLASEQANLHDVSARYQRIVGDLPAADLQALAVLDDGMAPSSLEALRLALQRSPSISAAVESLRAARSAVKTRESALQPRIEARARGGAGKNLGSVAGQRAEMGAEVVVNWNLFDSGSDMARVRQQAMLLNQAADLRDKACRDTRQTTLIAYNDVVRLTAQLSLLERNTQAIEKARDAYRQQFDIGQRSLLDVLNAENEAYTARRSMANAVYDRAQAFARTHAAMTQLNQRLGLSRGVQGNEDAGWTAGADSALRCPVQVVDATALEVAAPKVEQPLVISPVVPSGPAQPMPQATAEPAQLPAATPPAPIVTNAAVAAPRPAAAPSGAGSAPDVFTDRINDWAAAWSAKDFAAYSAFYAPNFGGTEGSAGAWAAKRKRMLGKRGALSVSVAGVNTVHAGEGMVETRFTQTYKSADFNDVSEKVLTWKLLDGSWRIVGESNR